MKLYFRANISYDFSRVGYDDISLDYSLNPFNKETPIRGYYEYTEFELPQTCSAERAKAVAEKMLGAFYKDGTPLRTTFEKLVK